MEYIKKISEYEHSELKRYKDQPLINHHMLCYLVDFEVLEKEITNFFFGKKKQLYLTKYKVAYYNTLEKKVFIGNDTKALKWLNITGLSDNRHTLAVCRENYLNVKQTMEGFGHKIISDKELKEKENGEKN